MGDEKRGKAFVAYLRENAVARGGKGGEWTLSVDPIFHPPSANVACVVTPLLPDDPRVGETWHDTIDDCAVVVCSAPYEGENGDAVVRVRDVTCQTSSRARWIEHLSRPPVLRTVTLTLTEEEARVAQKSAWSLTEAGGLLAKLGKALEEA